MTRRAPALVLAPLLAAACTPPEPPVLTLGDRPCDASPAFETAIPVPFDTLRGANARLGPEGRCLRPVGVTAPTTYAAFALPPGLPPATLGITSIAEGTLVAPQVTLHDAAGGILRTLSPEDFRADVRGLQAGVRLRGTERWVVVAADRARLGQPVTLRLGDADAPPARYQVAATYFIAPPPTPTDVRRVNDATYALNGTIHLTLAAIPTIP